MRLEIKNDGAYTSLKINGVEMGNVCSAFVLSQTAGELPTLTVTVPVCRPLDFEIPDGAVIIEREVETGAKP